MIIKSKRAWIAYGRGLTKVSDVWIKIKMSNTNIYNS